MGCRVQSTGARSAGCGLHVKGDRVGLLLPKSFEILIGMFGTLKAGLHFTFRSTIASSLPAASAQPDSGIGRLPVSARSARSTAPLLNELLREPAITANVGWMDGGADLGRSGASAVLGWPGVAVIPPTSSVPTQSSGGGEDIAHLLFTSGTTGAPKASDDYALQCNDLRRLGSAEIRDRVRRPGISASAFSLRSFHLRHSWNGCRWRTTSSGARRAEPAAEPAGGFYSRFGTHSVVLGASPS